MKTPRPMGSRVLHRVRVTAPKGKRRTSGVLIQARLYIHRQRGIKSRASKVDDVVMMILPRTRKSTIVFGD